MVNKLVKKLILDLDRIPNKQAAKKEVGLYVVNEVIRHLERGKSPVKGEIFDKLTKEYADEEKQGNRKPNLNLEGDLREAISFRTKGVADGIEYGVYGKEVDKADGHNQLTGKAKSWASKTGFPQRRFIADKGQKLKPSIVTGINKILDKHRVEVQELEPEVTEEVITDEGIEITIEDLFSQFFEGFE